MALTIEQAVYDQANLYAQQGDVANAWLTLANAGDSYAKQAYAILAEPDSLYARLVETQWSLHATPEQIEQNFGLVAEQHVTQGEGTGSGLAIKHPITYTMLYEQTFTT